MTRHTVVLITMLVACTKASAEKATMSSCSMHATGEASAWRVYTDLRHHFCFRYPRSYTPMAQPKSLCTKPALRDKDGDEIYVCVADEKFELSALAERAPTGIDGPPVPVRIGDNTFYYYGPGGGGVFYPDQYYFNLKGKTLRIDFDGPYEDGIKTPTAEGKKMERKILASFREF